MMFEIIPVQW